MIARYESAFWQPFSDLPILFAERVGKGPQNGTGGGDRTSSVIEIAISMSSMVSAASGQPFCFRAGRFRREGVGRASLVGIRFPNSPFSLPCSALAARLFHSMGSDT